MTQKLFPSLLSLFKGSSSAAVLPVQRRIRINQVGYLPDAPKIAVIVKPPSEYFEVRTIDPELVWKSVLRKKLIRQGKHFLADFSEITAPGDYCIVCGERSNDSWAPTGKGLQSHSFVVLPDVYTHVARMFAEYFLWQRCGSPKGWAGQCHQDPVPLVGTDRQIDVRGGYHQSCDLRCWGDGISMSCYAYLRYAQIARPHWDDGQLAEEVRWGCDYFLKIIAPEGFLYDSQFVPIGWGPCDYYNSPVNLGAHCNVVALLARAAVFFAPDDPQYAAKCREGAEKIWSYINTSDAFDRAYVPPVSPLPAGTQGAEFYFEAYKTSAVGIAGRIVAALELGERDIAVALGRQLLELQTEAGYFRQSAESEHPAFVGCTYTFAISGPLALVALLQHDPENAALWRSALTKYADCMAGLFDSAEFDSIPRFRFNLARKMLETNFGSGSGGAMHNAVLFAQCAKLLNAPRFRQYAQRCFDWICGANPEEASCITGVGYNQKRNPVFGQFFPSTPQIPGGVQHTLPGEYDMPAVAMALWTIALLSGYGEPLKMTTGNGQDQQAGTPE